ncbi:SDR family NAD(P)-dependent oxidoreductase [Streptomyces sp. NPDC001222]|uniref:SDR family NAD(P)-dependent oxidoreductase n=1 Tax=Streptomyces sp. NPDC001222 TaxID=3364548 RepID=UPI00367F5996
MHLRDARVLLTGATGGIGHAIAEALAARGAQLVLTGRRADVLEDLAGRLGGRALAADLSDPDGARDLLGRAGRVDIVVANAALPASGAVPELSVEDIDRMLDVNLRAPVVMARLAAEAMISRRSGHLVFISSLMGKTASGGAALYSASKFGMRGFALALREDLQPYGVGVTTVFPGFIRDAGMFARTGVSLPRGVGTRTPRDVARAVLRAVDRNPAEIDVAPLGLRLGAMVGGVAPTLSAMVQRRAGGDRITAEMAETQRSAR